MMIDNRKELLAGALRAEEMGDLARAASFLEEIVRIFPDDAKTRTWLGKLYGDREQYAAAVEILESSIAIDGERARPHAVLAEVLLALNRFREAERAIRRSVQLAPTSASLVVLGYALSAQTRQVEAQEAFRRALELDMENEEAMYNLALEIRNGEPDEALALLKSAVQIDPLYADGYREYGFQLAVMQDFVRAEEALRTALSLNESDSASHVYLANVLASNGNMSEAESELKRACELSPLSALPHWGLGKLYEHEGRNSEAEAFFRLAASLQPNSAEASFQIGRFLVTLGNAEEGATWLDRAIAQDPSHEEAARMKRRLSE